VPRSQRPKPITFDEFSKTFLENRLRHRKPATYVDFEKTIRLHITPYIGTVKLSELTDDAIKAM